MLSGFRSWVCFCTLFGALGGLSTRCNNFFLRKPKKDGNRYGSSASFKSPFTLKLSNIWSFSPRHHVVEVGVHRVVEFPDHVLVDFSPGVVQQRSELLSCPGVFLGDRILEVGPEIFDRIAVWTVGGPLVWTVLSPVD